MEYEIRYGRPGRSEISQLLLFIESFNIILQQTIQGHSPHKPIYRHVLPLAYTYAF